MLVGSLTTLESRAAFLRGTSPEAGGRTGAGSAANMTAALAGVGGAPRRGKARRREGGNGYNGKQGSG